MTTNPANNRYANVPCLQRSRVLLDNNSYIHANWVNLRASKTSRYIATQVGPQALLTLILTLHALSVPAAQHAAAVLPDGAPIPGQVHHQHRQTGGALERPLAVLLAGSRRGNTAPGGWDLKQQEGLG